MNILFIYSRQDRQSVDKPLLNPKQIQFGISYISALLKKHGYNTELLVLDRETNKKRLNRCIDRFFPKLICFTAVYTEYSFIVSIAQYIKHRYPDIFLLVGGPHVSLNPEDCLLDCFDALCIGEGEYPVLELVQQLHNNRIPSDILNLWIKHKYGVQRNPPRPFLENLNSLPFPDRQIWQRWISEPGKHFSVLLGRGCPYLCTYCCNHGLRNLAQGSYVRFRSPDNIVEEIKQIVTDCPTAEEIYLEVETILINNNFTIELCSKLERLNAALAKPLYFGVNIRVAPNINVENVFSAFKKSNFKFLQIGVESGSQKVRTQILKRYYANEDIIKIVHLARKYDLKVCFFNLIGIPGETKDDFKETVEINRKCLPDWYFLSIFFPYPGTDLYNTVIQQGLIKLPLDVNMERNRAVVNLPGFSRKQIQSSYIWFDYYVYKGYKSLYKILARVLASGIKTNYYLNSFYKNLTNFNIFRWLQNTLRGYYS